MLGARQSYTRILPLLVLTAIVVAAIYWNPSGSRRFDKAATARTYANLPVNFVENAGQTDARVRFYAQGAGFAFYLTAQEAVFRFASRSVSRAALLTPVADQVRPGRNPAFAICRWQSERDRHRRGARVRGGQLLAWRRFLTLAAGLVAVPSSGLP